MNPFLTMLAYTAASGACIVVGGLAASVERVRPRWLEQELRHSVIAFGGGVLVAAIAFVLVPEGQRFFGGPVPGTGIFLLGGVVFLLFERYLSAHRRQLPQTIAMLLDFIPESLAMGGMFALGSPSAPLLAVLIGLQNLPEAFNAYRELLATENFRPRRTLLLMAALAAMGPLAGGIGWVVAFEHPRVVGATMLFAAGGILYLLFQDIAPKARLERHWAPTIGAVLGFCFGMLAEILVSSP